MFISGPRLCVGQQFALTEMSYTICRIFQRFSRLECRVPPVVAVGGLTVNGGSEKEKFSGLSQVEAGNGLRGIGRSSVRRMADSRELKYKSEIVLQPADAVRVAFWE